MPDGLNLVQLIGYLGTDPEMRFTVSGAAVTTFRMAVSRSYMSDGGDRQEHTEWFSVVTWNKLAEVLAQHLKKGRKVYCSGRLQTRSWESNDGVKHYRTEVIASQVLFLDRAEAEQASYVGASELDPDDLPFDD